MSFRKFGYQLLFVTFSFVVYYFVLLLLTAPILILVVYRAVLAFIFLQFYQGRYKLINCFDSVLAVDRPANVLTITFFVYIQGLCDMLEVRRRFETAFLHYKTKDGNRPWEKMVCAAVKKWGFMCWENKRESFDITQHVRVCPGVGNPNKVYTEAEMFSSVAQLANVQWTEDKPRWEVLIVPRMKKDNDETEVEYSAFCVRVHHVYGDGISVTQICRLVGMDKPSPALALNPVNPPVPKIPWYTKALWGLQIFFLGPSTCMKLLSYKDKLAFYEGPLQGPKYFGRTHMPISVSMLRNIRKCFDCSTNAILHSAFLGALQALTLKKRVAVTRPVVSCCSLAKFPYRHEYPQNSVYFSSICVPMEIANPLKRLSVMDHVYKQMVTCVYDKIVGRWMVQAIGLFPVAVINQTFGSIQCSYMLANVPGFPEKATIAGNLVTNLFGVGPLAYGTRFFLGVGVLQDQFTFGFHFEKSSLIEDGQDVLDFIRAFEMEIKYLDSMCHV